MEISETKMPQIFKLVILVLVYNVKLLTHTLKMKMFMLMYKIKNLMTHALKLRMKGTEEDIHKEKGRNQTKLSKMKLSVWRMKKVRKV